MPTALENTVHFLVNCGNHVDSNIITFLIELWKIFNTDKEFLKGKRSTLKNRGQATAHTRHVIKNPIFSRVPNWGHQSAAHQFARQMRRQQFAVRCYQ